MMKMFERSIIGQFPGLPDSVVGKWRSKDTTTWKALAEPAEYVRATCRNGCGFAVTGKELAIGVAIWYNGSTWDTFTREVLAARHEVKPVLDVADSSVPSMSNGSVVEALR